MAEAVVVVVGVGNLVAALILRQSPLAPPVGGVVVVDDGDGGDQVGRAHNVFLLPFINADVDL